METVATLTGQLARMNERVGELLAIAQRKQRKVTEPKPPPSPPNVGRDEGKAFQERPRAPARSPAEKTEKKKSESTGRKPIPGHLEAEEHELSPNACAHTAPREIAPRFAAVQRPAPVDRPAGEVRRRTHRACSDVSPRSGD